MKQSATLLRDTTERQTITVSKEGWKKVKKKELSSSAVSLDCSGLPAVLSGLAEGFPGWSSSPGLGWRRRDSHATGGGTGAPPVVIYRRPAPKGQERGHDCFPFHSPGPLTRPHTRVVNIYPNTGSCAEMGGERDGERKRARDMWRGTELWVQERGGQSWLLVKGVLDLD